MRKYYYALALLISLLACKDIDSLNDLSPNQETVISTGADLQNTLSQAYATWWQAIHGPYPNLALLVAGDAYGLSRGQFATIEMGMEARTAFYNRANAPEAVQQVTALPWDGSLRAVSSANDVLNALDRGIGLDKGGEQDQGIRAAAHLLRGLSWGYLALLFDQGVKVEYDDDLSASLPLLDYTEMAEAAVEELELAIELTENLSSDFVHEYFNGVTLDQVRFIQLAHAYAARFLAQLPRTPVELTNVNWEAVFFHAERGIDFDFAPKVDGKDWQSYHQYVFAETGRGPFWASVDQRIVATLDPSQPARYPEVEAKAEAPISNKKAQSADERLSTDFSFAERIFFDSAKGEWHFSHYKHSRNINDASFEGDGWSFGQMPVFLQADNDLLQAEAALRIGSITEAQTLLNSGSRTTRGNLSALNTTDVATLEQAIFYERTIELLGSAPLSLWLDRRRLAPRDEMESPSALGGLQVGTPAQLPVPNRELMIRGLDIYSFGGANDPEGVNAVVQ
ncbi:MAG: hypothetical protein AAF847_07805 [Bacteroidota bacterium]